MSDLERLPDQETLQRLLDYDPETGVLTWRKRPAEMFTTRRAASVWNARYAGKTALAGAHKHGYLQVDINGRKFLAHRVIWKITHGTNPDNIDHVNGARSDNRISNLRSVSKLENGRNQCIRSSNTSGANGVHLNKEIGKWVAYIRDNGVRRHLGYYDTFDAAVAARKDADRACGYHENHGRARR